MTCDRRGRRDSHIAGRRVTCQRPRSLLPPPNAIGWLTGVRWPSPRPPHRVAQGELSLLLASLFAGGAIGAPLLGWFGDRYASELFPTPLRASAIAGAWGLGRAVSALVPLILLPLLTGYGSLAMFATVAAALLSSVALIGLAGPPGLARKPLN